VPREHAFQLHPLNVHCSSCPAYATDVNRKMNVMIPTRARMAEKIRAMVA
jgi:hypothetical protein